jgi:hypothetical protein
MGKGKYKRKRERAKQRAHQQAEQTPFPDSVVVPTKEQGKTPKTTESKRSDKKESSMGLREMMKRSSFTDWCIMLFTGVLAVAAIYQFIIMGSQLDTMRKDQRPWIKITFSADKIAALAPLGGTIHLVNSGKTPAKGIVHGEFVVEIIKNGNEPKLDYPSSPHAHFTTGMIVPNDAPNDVAVYRMREEANSPSGAVADTLTVNEVEDFTGLKTFIIIYGTVHYADFFGADHWTKFCQPIIRENANAVFTFRPCSNYGDVDSN